MRGAIDDGDRRVSAQVMVGGGLLVAFLVVLAVSVVWVSNDSKHPLVLPNPSAPTTSAPASPTVAAGPIPLPVTTTRQPPPVDTPVAPAQAMSPTELTAETMTPAPPQHGHRRLHQFFPHQFPSG